MKISEQSQVRLQKTYLTICGLFILSIILCNLKRLSFLCMNANDFGIQLQAAMELSTLKSFNPFNTIMQIHIFNDHFDPGMILLAIPMMIFGPHPELVMIVEWLAFVSIFLFLFFTLRPTRLWSLDFLIPVTLVVFSRSLLQGLEFPVHPGTSVMIVLFATTFAIIKDKNPFLIFALALLACSFREILSLMFVGMGGVYLLQGRFKVGLSTLLAGLLWLYLFLVLRPQILGEGANYGQTMLAGFSGLPLSGQLALLFKKLIAFQVLEWKPFAGLLFLSFLTLWKDRPSWRLLLKHPLIPIYTAMLIGTVIHLFAGRLAHHHSIPIVTPLLCYLCYYPFMERSLFSRRWVIVATLLLTIGTSIGRYTKFINNIILARGPRCDMSRENAQAVREFKTFMKGLPVEATFMATETAASAILLPGRKVYEYAFYRQHPEFYDYVVWDRNPDADYWPLSFEEAQRIFNKCKDQGKLIFENRSYAILSGKVSDACLETSRLALFRSLHMY
ncbi:MAG: hypothetical protein A2X86_02740 [Bdellovibrionales bacterium GWA2_49_15]|nr:MAG: hypothetical protein A2X86_02740 [Bdellovibrionales bacterium GWA2_49_15]HAZ14144.1 hypothetical protein [Bdellovibrionales bacterium]